MKDNLRLSRRGLLRSFAAAGATAVLGPRVASSQPRVILTRPIPSSSEAMPVVGLGSWITFNVGDDIVARDACTEVMRTFFTEGGRMIDSSPMYGSSQKVIGYGLAKLSQPAALATPDLIRGSGQRGDSMVRAHSASEDARERAGDTRPEPGSSARARVFSR